MNLSAPHWELASLGRGTTTTTKRVLFRCFRIRSSSIHATSSRASRAAAAAGVVALTRKWRTTPGTAGTAAAAAATGGGETARPASDTRWWCRRRCRWRGRKKRRKRRWWTITTGALRCRCCCRRRGNSSRRRPVSSSSPPQPPQQPRLSLSRSAVVRWSRGTSKGPANPDRSGRYLGNWSGIRTSGADIIEQREYPGERTLADKGTTTRVTVARIRSLSQRRETQTAKETAREKTKRFSDRERRDAETRLPVQEGVDACRCAVEKKNDKYLARIIEWPGIAEVTVASASQAASRAASRKHEESRIGEQRACREAGLSLGGSDAGPPAAARPQYGSSTPRVHREPASPSSSSSSSAGVRDTGKQEAAATRSVVGGRRRSTLHAEERRRGGARRQDVGDVSVPDHLLAPMRLDPFGLTGPPTSKKRRREKKREEKKEQQQLWSSSSSSSASFVECVRFVRAASTRSFSGSIRDRVEARHHDGPDDNEEAGTATAFRVPRDSASRGVVRARTRDCHEDHEDENDYDGDADVGVVLAGAPPARTRILCVDRPSPQRRAPRFARRARGRARRRRERGPIPEERPDVAASVVSFVDVLAYTAYSDDRDDDDDDDGDDEGRTRYKRKRIHGGPEEDHDKHTENGNDDDNDARVSVPGNEQERRDAKENAPREDYIRAEVDTINRGVPKDDHQWASPSSSLDGREDRRCECIDNYDCEHPTVDEEFDGQGRRKGEGWRRSDNTAWFQKPITRRRGGGTGEKPRTRRSYYRLLLFMLYLLAWPLLCSTSPSGHFTSTFTQNPTLAHIKNPAQRGNASPPDVSYLSSTVIMQHQHQQPQQYVQGSDYNTDNERHRHHQQQQQEQQQERKEKRENSGREKELQSRFPDRTIYNWDVNQLNPWLSACDLAGPAPADLQGSCGPPEVPKSCPMPCENDNEMIGERAGINSARTTTTRTGVEDRYGEEKKKEEGVRTAREQCLLYLEESHKGKICRDDSARSTPNFSLRKDRYRFVSRLRLRHCCEQAVVNALAPGKDGPLEDVLNGGQKCADTLDKLLIIDALAARLHCEFEEVLARYDCAQPYSVIHNCTHCKEAYRKWVCSSLVPYFAHGGPMDAETPGGSRTGTRLRPCRSFCQSVEQRCPYLLPGDRAPAYPTQYAGEPTFLCGDPNIPETGEQAARALHNSNDNECCFHVCAEDAPISGICANCEEPWKNGRYDPSTAPQCDTAAPQSGPTDQQYPGSQAGQPEAVTDREPADDGQETSTASSSSNTPASSSTTTTDKQGTLFCGSGRIGSIPSASSPGRSSPSIVLQLFWLCSVLISLPANALQYNLASSWSPFGFFRLIGSGLPGAFVLRRTFNDLRASAFDPRSAGIYRHAVVRCLLFILWMPRRAVTKCRRRGWWWWRSWRRSSSRHFRWKLPRRASGVASWRSILRDASISSILVLFLKFAEKCRCRDWWWLWRRWRKCGSTDGQDAGLVRRKRSTTVHGTRRRGHRRGRGPSGIFETDVASLAKATSRKDPP